MYYTNLQILVYAYAIDIVVSSKQTLIEVLNALESSSKEIGIRINEQNAKYIPLLA